MSTKLEENLQVPTVTEQERIL